MSIEQMRWQIMKAYPGSDWVADCYAMRDTQVAATYQRLLSNKQIVIQHRRKR